MLTLFLGTRSFNMLLASLRKQVLFIAVCETTDPRHLRPAEKCFCEDILVLIYSHWNTILLLRFFFFQNISSFFKISRDLACTECLLVKNDSSVVVRFKVLIARLSALSLQVVHVL